MAGSGAGAHHQPHGDITHDRGTDAACDKAVTMQHGTRSRYGALAVLAAMALAMLAWSPAASAEQRTSQSRSSHAHHQARHQNHAERTRKNDAHRVKAHAVNAHATAQQQRQSAAAAKSPLDDLLDGLLGDKGLAGKHGPVSKVVSDSSKSVKKTVDDTTKAIDTALGRDSSTPPAPKPSAPTSSAPTHPANAASPGTPPATTQHAAATSGPPAAGGGAAAVRIAPLDSPALVPVKQPAGEHSEAPAEVEPPRAAALTPASLLSAPGTGVLVGLMFAFAAGVFAVVYGGGYRGRRSR